MTRYRVTIRGDKVELRGYVTAPTEQALRAAAEAATPLGLLAASPVSSDYDPFARTVTDSMVGAAMNAVVSYYADQGHVTDPASVDYQALRAGLEAVIEPSRLAQHTFETDACVTRECDCARREDDR